MVGLTEASCIDARQETKLCWMKEDCIEMSWNVESIFYMHGRCFHKQSIFGCFAWLYWPWYAIQFLMEMMTGILPPSRSTQGLAFSPCPRMNARTVKKKTEEEEEEAIPNLVSQARSNLTIRISTLWRSDPECKHYVKGKENSLCVDWWVGEARTERDHACHDFDGTER